MGESLFTTAFEKDFKDNIGFLRGLELFIEWRGLSYSEKEIIDFLKTDYSMSYFQAILVFRQLIENKCIFWADNKTHEELYQLNEKNPLVQYFMKKFDEIVQANLLKRAKKYEASVKHSKFTKDKP